MHNTRDKVFEVSFKFSVCADDIHVAFMHIYVCLARARETIRVTGIVLLNPPFALTIRHIYVIHSPPLYDKIKTKFTFLRSSRPVYNKVPAFCSRSRCPRTGWTSSSSWQSWVCSCCNSYGPSRTSTSTSRSDRPPISTAGSSSPTRYSSSAMASITRCSRRMDRVCLCYT